MLARIKSLAGQSLIYGIGGMLPKAIGFLLLPLYTRLLSPADYGILAFTSTLSAVIQIFFELGISGAITRFYYDFLDRKNELRSYLGTIWIFLTALSFTLAILLSLFGDTLFTALFKETSFYPYGFLTIWISFFTVASTIPLMLFRVREQPKYYVLMTVGRFLVMTLAIIYFVAVLRQGAAGSLRGQLLAGMLFFIPFTFITIRNSNWSIRSNYLKATLIFSLPLVPHLLSGWALSVSDRIILERYVSLDQLGLYSLGYRMAMILDILLTSINMAWSPYFFRLSASEEDAPQTIARITTYFSITMMAFGLIVAVLSQDVIRIMADAAFWGAYQIVPIVVIAFLSHGFYFMLVNQLFFAKATRRLALFTVISASTNIILNVWLVPQFGIIAAAWNTVIGYTLLAILVYFESRRVYPIPYEYKRIGIVLLAGLATYFLGIQINLANPYLSIAIRSLSLLAFPIFLFIFGFLSPRETKGIKSIPTRTKNWYLSRKSNYDQTSPPAG